LGGALEAREIDASEGKLQAEATGEIEKDNGSFVIRRIHVTYLIQASPDALEKIERVHGIHKEHCPVYRSLYKAIEITTEFRLI